MDKVLIIGCTETTKVLVPALVKDTKLVSELCVASKTKEECDEYRKKYMGAPVRIITAGIDVTNEEKTLLMMRIFGPSLIINLAPSRLNKTIMEIALKIGASYIDTSYTDETGDTSIIDQQFELSSQFYAKKLVCITGCSFNPAAYVTLTRLILNRRMLDTISGVDIIKIDSTKNDSGVSLPSVAEIKKLHEDSRVLEDGELKTMEALKYKTTRTFPGMGRRTLYAFDNSVIDSYKRGMPDIKNVRYFSSLRKPHLTLVNTLKKIGMISTDPISIKGVKISPLEYLEEVMPKPEDNASSHKGTVNIGLLATGKKNGEDKSVLMYFVSDQEKAYNEYGVTSLGLMSALTTLACFKLVASKRWANPGVFTPGDFEPEFLLNKMDELGLEYNTQLDADPIVIEEVEEEQDD